MQKQDVKIVVVSKRETTTMSKLVIAKNATTTDAIRRARSSDSIAGEHFYEKIPIASDSSQRGGSDGGSRKVYI